MEKTRLVAGKNGLENIIQWVTVIEIVEDIERLQKGEFLITTGFNLPEDKERLDSFHQLLEAKLLSGVAIYTSFYMKEIPKSFIELANKHHLPLIEIPVDINFSEITKEMLEQIVNRQASLLAHSEKTHHELSQLVLNDKSLTEVTKRLAQLTDSHIIIYNEFYEIIYENHDPSKINQRASINGMDEGMDITPHLLHSLNREAKENVVFGHKLLTIYPIIAKQSCFGWIVMCKSRSQWQEMDDVAIARSSTIYAMEFLKKQAIEETQMRIQSNVLEDIFNKTYPSERHIMDQALKLDYDLSRTQCVFHLTFIDPSNSDIHIMDRLYHMTESLLVQKNKQHLIQTKLQSILFITNVNGETKAERYYHAKQLAKELVNDWKFYFPNNELIVGIGKSYDHMEQLQKSAQEAKYAVTLYPLLEEQATIIHYDDLGMYDFLINMMNNGINIRQIYEEHINGMIADTDREIDLIETISVYFKNNQSIQKSAEKLYIHRHTLRYRLNQIEERTGLSLKATDDLLKLQLGVMAYKLSNLLGKNV